MEEQLKKLKNLLYLITTLLVIVIFLLVIQMIFLEASFRDVGSLIAWNQVQIEQILSYFGLEPVAEYIWP